MASKAPNKRPSLKEQFGFSGEGGLREVLSKANAQLAAGVSAKVVAADIFRFFDVYRSGVRTSGPAVIELIFHHPYLVARDAKSVRADRKIAKYIFSRDGEDIHVATEFDTLAAAGDGPGHASNRKRQQKFDIVLDAKFAGLPGFTINLKEPQKDEGTIDGKSPRHPAESRAPLELPKSPPRMWPGRKPGGQATAENDPLLVFLEDAYGRYLPASRNKLRTYIRKHDPTLYDAIRAFEKTRELPDHLKMPSTHDQFLVRAQQAQKTGFAGLNDEQKARAIAALKRAEKKPRPPSP